MMDKAMKLTLFCLMVLAIILSKLLQPTLSPQSKVNIVDFKAQLPKQFAAWHQIPNRKIAVNVYQTSQDEKSTDNPYDAVLIRNYEHANGNVVQLAIAYAQSQTQEIKVHRPDLCYYAQGYTVNQLIDKSFQLASISSRIDGQIMQVSNQSDTQLVSYWIRIGDLFSQSAWQTRIYLIEEGLIGKVPDGVLVRVSSTIEDHNVDAVVRMQEQFVNDMLLSIKDRALKALLLGKLGSESHANIDDKVIN